MAIWLRSIELERFLVVDLEAWVLRLFPEQAVADRQHLDPRAHETTEGVFWRADDGFSRVVLYTRASLRN